MKNKKISIILDLPDHFLRELIKLDEGKDITLLNRILIILGDFINKKKGEKVEN